MGPNQAVESSQIGADVRRLVALNARRSALLRPDEPARRIRYAGRVRNGDARTMSISAEDWVAITTVEHSVFDRWPNDQAILVASDHAGAHDATIRLAGLPATTAPVRPACDHLVSRTGGSLSRSGQGCSGETGVVPVALQIHQ